MQPLEIFETFDPELSSLGFVEPIEGRIEDAILRAIYGDEVLTHYFTGGVYPVEAEELADEQGKVARSLYLALATTEQKEEVGEWATLTTNWLFGIVVDRKPSLMGTGRLRRMAIARQIRNAVYGTTNGALSDARGLVTEATMEWGTVSKPAVYPGGSLLVTLMPLKLTSNISTRTQEFIE